MAKLTEKSGQKVIFRRIRGRLVPIKVNAKSSGGFKAARTRRTNTKKSNADIFKGAGLIGGGIGITVGSDLLSGFLSGFGAKKFASNLAASRDLTRAGQAAAALGKKPSITQLSRAGSLFNRFVRGTSRINKATAFLKAGGALLGVGIVSSGVNEVTQGFAKRDTGVSGEILSHVIGTGITVLGARALRKGLKLGLGKRSPLKVKDGQLAFKFETGQQPGF